MGEYGLNNIVYIPGLGSFHRMVAFFSDLPCDHDEWRELRRADRCKGCQACTRACPTGAIDRDRVVVRAERCMTYWNEKPGNVPFPSWVDASSHDCLVGCVACQRPCPLDKDVKDWFVEGATFTEEETEQILAGPKADQLPQSTVSKLQQSDLLRFLHIIPRNIRAILGSA